LRGRSRQENWSQRNRTVTDNRWVPWTWHEIESEWLGGPSPLAYEPDVVIEAFETVETHLGRDWMDAERTTQGVRSMGLAPTLGIVSTGKLLASLNGVLGGPGLVAKLREREVEAMSEALAIHLLRAQTRRRYRVRTCGRCARATA
jgi:hypothetical protein